jgi:hypothetical protein
MDAASSLDTGSAGVSHATSSSDTSNEHRGCHHQFKYFKEKYLVAEIYQMSNLWI